MIKRLKDIEYLVSLGGGSERDGITEMSCSNCMRNLMEENMKRLQDKNEILMELIEKLRDRGWDADAHFSQDGNIHVFIRREKKNE